MSYSVTIMHTHLNWSKNIFIDTFKAIKTLIKSKVLTSLNFMSFRAGRNIAKTPLATDFYKLIQQKNTLKNHHWILVNPMQNHYKITIVQQASNPNIWFVEL